MGDMHLMTWIMNNAFKYSQALALTLGFNFPARAFDPGITAGTADVISFDDRLFLNSLDRGGREMWRRRLSRGLSASEREFMNLKIEELKNG